MQTELKTEGAQKSSAEKNDNCNHDIEGNVEDIAEGRLDEVQNTDSMLNQKNKRIPIYQMNFKESLFMAMTSGAIGNVSSFSTDLRRCKRVDPVVEAKS